MRFRETVPVLVIATLGYTQEALARVHVHVDLSSQTMHVESSHGTYLWPVSTARAGYITPRGYYSARSLQRMHYSQKYDMSPMPYSIFFRGGYAIHGSYATGALGRPASHGCIRLAPGNAAVLYHLVQEEGASIAISGSPPRAFHYASARSFQPVRQTLSPRQATFSNPLLLLFGD